MEKPQNLVEEHSTLSLEDMLPPSQTEPKYPTKLSSGVVVLLTNQETLSIHVILTEV